MQHPNDSVSIVVPRAAVDAANLTGRPVSVRPGAFAELIKPSATDWRMALVPGAFPVNGGAVDSDHNRKLSQAEWFGSNGQLGQLDQMVREWPVLQAGRLAWTLATLSREWSVEPAKGGVRDDLMVAEFLRTCIFDHFRAGSGGMLGLISIFADLPWRGFVAAQHYYPTDRTLTVWDDAGKVVMEGAQTLQMATIQPWNIEAWVPYAGRNGERQWGVEVANPGGDVGPNEAKPQRLVKLAPEQVALARFLPAGDEPNPMGLLRPAWGGWQEWRTLSRLSIQGWQKAAFGIPEVIISPEANPAELATVNDIVGNLRAGALARFSLPPGYSVKWHEVPFRAEGIVESKDALKREVLAGMFAQHVGTGTDGVGSNALHGSQKQEFHALASIVSRNIVQTLAEGPTDTAPLKRVCSLNFADLRAYPILTFGPMPISDPMPLVDALSGAIASGALTLDGGIEGRVRELLMLPEMPAETREAWRAKLENTDPPDIKAAPEEPPPAPPPKGAPVVDEGGEIADEVEDDAEDAPVAAAEHQYMRASGDSFASGPRGRPVRPIEQAVRLSETVGQMDAGRSAYADALTAWRESVAPVYGALLSRAGTLDRVAEIAVPGQAELRRALTKVLRKVYSGGRESVVAELRRMELDPSLARAVADGEATVGRGGDIPTPERFHDCLAHAPALHAVRLLDALALAGRAVAPKKAKGLQRSIFDVIDPEESIDAVVATTIKAAASRILAASADALQVAGVGGTLPAAAEIVGLVRGVVESLSSGAEEMQAQGDVNTLFGLGRAQEQRAEGVERFVYSNLLESNTCDSCAALDGEVFGADDYELYATPLGPPLGPCEGGNRCGCLVLSFPPGVDE